MAESDNRDIDLILAFLEDRLTEAEADRVAARLKTDTAFAKQLAVQARLTTGLEAMAKLASLAPEMQAAAGTSAAATGSREHRKVTRLTTARGRRRWTRHVPTAAAALLLIALGLGGWWYANREVALVAGDPSQQPHSEKPARVAMAEIQFVPAQLAERDRPVIIRATAPTAEGATEVATPGVALYAGDRLVTLNVGGANSVQVTLKHLQGATIDVGADSEIRFPAEKTAASFNINHGLELSRGRLYVDMGVAESTTVETGSELLEPEGLSIATPNAEFSAQRASYELISGNSASVARVTAGLLQVANRLGLQLVGALEECVVTAQSVPGDPVTVFAGAIWRGRQGLAGGEPGPNLALAGMLTLERPTLVCLGARWVIHGDQNRNAVVYCNYRPVAHPGQAATSWQRSLNFWAVDPNGWPDGYRLENGPGPGDTMYAGSLFDLQENTLYELEFHLEDPDGQSAVRRRQQATRGAPAPAAGGRTLFIAPDPTGEGGGTGTAADPFRGLKAADAAAQPGDTFHLAAGVYSGTWKVTASGEPGRPIVWQGASDGESILEGSPDDGQTPMADRAISANGIHDVIFDRLTIRRANYLVVAHAAQRLSITRCRMQESLCAVTGGDKETQVQDFYLADNTILGMTPWPSADKGAEPGRAIYLSGQGHVICHNRVSNFGDGIDTAPGVDTAAVDIYHNDIDSMTDDGIELDFSHRNIRCFRNRITNVFQGISLQPVHGGPVYVLRNTIYNVELEAIKLHNSPNGALVLHNTTVRNGSAAVLSTAAPVYRCLYRNNLLIGTSANFGLLYDAPMLQCDFDYDGIGGQFEKLMLWNRTAIAKPTESRTIETHAVMVDPAGCFRRGPSIADGEPQVVNAVDIDLRLAPGSQAIDKGCVLPGINADYQGQAPDLGAFEAGSPLPTYGPRPVKP